MNPILEWLLLGSVVASIVGVAVLILRWNDRRKVRRKSNGSDRSNRRQAMALGYVLLVMVLSSLIPFLMSPHGNRRLPGRPPQQLPDYFFLGILAVGLGVALLVAAWVAYLARPRPEPKSAPRKVGTGWILGLILILGALISIASRPTLLGLLVVLVGAVLGYVGGQFLVGFWWNDRKVREIVRRSTESGDTDGAIDELRDTIEIQGPTVPRLNALGCLLGERGDWSEAHKAFLELERMAGRRPVVLQNLANALSKLGRTEEAVALLREAIEKAPTNEFARCQFGLILLDLGRIDEAREQLTEAEQNKTTFLGPHARDASVERDLRLAELRDRLQAAEDPAFKATQRLEEL